LFLPCLPHSFLPYLALSFGICMSPLPPAEILLTFLLLILICWYWKQPPVQALCKGTYLLPCTTLPYPLSFLILFCLKPTTVDQGIGAGLDILLLTAVVACVSQAPHPPHSFQQYLLFFLRRIEIDFHSGASVISAGSE
jgi:hypothetical protein